MFSEGGGQHKVSCLFSHQGVISSPIQVLGWYHSHPHITVWPSHVDVGTQADYQLMDSNFIGLIFSCFNDADKVTVLFTWHSLYLELAIDETLMPCFYMHVLKVLCTKWRSNLLPAVCSPGDMFPVLQQIFHQWRIKVDVYTCIWFHSIACAQLECFMHKYIYACKIQIWRE